MNHSSYNVLLILFFWNRAGTFCYTEKMSLDGAEAWGPIHTERGSVTDTISFESGHHALTSDALRRINAGDLHAHVWNKEVGDRINTNVLAIDSVFPVFDNALHHSNPGDPLNDELDYPLSEKKEVIAWEPIKDREILVVSGDMNYSKPAVDFTGSVPNYTKKGELIAQANAKNRQESSEYLPEFIVENAITGTAGFLTAALLTELGRQASNKIEIGDPNATKHMSRRKFLKLGAAIAGAGTALYVGGRAAASTLIPFTPNEKIHDIAEKILEVTPQPKLFEQHWLDGRTALLIEKCDSALRQGLTPPDAKGTVVMGNAHALEASNFMRNAKSRHNAIHSLASDIVGFYDRVLDDYPEVNKTWAINRLLDYMAQGDILSVTPPSSENVDKDEVDAEVNKNVRYLLSFTAPGVTSAISDLYRTEEYPEPANELVQQQAVETPPPAPSVTPGPPGGSKVVVPKIQ